MSNIETHMFWAYDDFSRLERFCANSFVQNGYYLNIWTYGKSEFIKGVKIKNAREIILEKLVFLNKGDSYASFADYFRYSLLCSVGGLYVDTDVVALKPAEILPTHSFLVTERTKESGLKVNNNVIFNPKPQIGNIIDLARVYSACFPKHNIQWDELGPILLTSFVEINPHHGFSIYEPNFANPIDWWDCPNKLIVDELDSIPHNSYFIHLYNETWRRAGIDKNSKFSNLSIYEQLSSRYGI